MRMSGILSLSLLLVGAVHAQDDPAKKELARLEGMWKYVKVEAPDKITEAIFKDSVMEIRGNKMIHKITLPGDKNEVHESTIALDPGKKPKAIDITPLDGPEKGKAMKGIYELDGDTLKMAFELGERPTDFIFKKGGAREVYTLKRVKK